MSNSLPDHLLAPDAYQPGQNNCDWMVELSFFCLADVPPANHTRFMLRFFSPATRKLALTAGFNINTPFATATALLSALFDNQLIPGTANQRFANLRQTRNQSVDEFTLELGHIASLAFPNLPQVDRDELILHHFVTGLLDCSTTNIFILHPQQAWRRQSGNARDMRTFSRMQTYRT
uniref:Retrotransposon gag domain-containing protein n=1 Tax=Schistocephalus solidus TaxID=70667 RepID=A0A0X3NMM4_SCHSO